jgi:hypothetical protein
MLTTEGTVFDPELRPKGAHREKNLKSQISKHTYQTNNPPQAEPKLKIPMFPLL